VTIDVSLDLAIDSETLETFHIKIQQNKLGKPIRIGTPNKKQQQQQLD